ncbi:MAG: dNTP triphosphohydrolase [Opitutales bacterium]|nr:dNTP triphosphohydrolase [Opitutales bacterium]
MNRFYGEFDYAHLPGKRPENDYRSPFQIDRDRILFSAPFRQLQSKTQVFQSGEYDFYRTRLTHTIEVARIGRSIAEYLNCTSERLRPDFFIDPDLVEGIGLAHDLGHPPFGHIGERKLNELMAEAGGFEGNAQTLRIVTELIYPRKQRPSGMKPTRAFLDGILKYKALRREWLAASTETLPAHHFLYDEQEPYRRFALGEDFQAGTSPAAVNAMKSLECQIMDWADDTAYSLHDIVDGVQARFITPEALRTWSDLEASTLSGYQRNVVEDMIDEIRRGGFEPRSSLRIGQFIQACTLEPMENALSAHSNRHRFRLHIDPKMKEVCDLHKRIAIDMIFRSAQLQQIEFKGGFVLSRLFAAYAEHALDDNGARRLRILPEPYCTWIEQGESRNARCRRLCDFLANLTDSQAIRTYKRLYDADFGSIMDHFS